jgi:hypothetical protein
MDKITFQEREYKVTQQLQVHTDLAAEGLQTQMIIEGKRGATYLLQIWQTQHGLIHKRMDIKGRLAVECIKLAAQAELDAELGKSDEEVELIASGYEWDCPHCEHFNREIEVTLTVTCGKCRHEFRVQDYHHAVG